VWLPWPFAEHDVLLLLLLAFTTFILQTYCDVNMLVYASVW
jgi:hypothetical protein